MNDPMRKKLIRKVQELSEDAALLSWLLGDRIEGKAPDASEHFTDDTGERATVELWRARESHGGVLLLHRPGAVQVRYLNAALMDDYWPCRPEAERAAIRKLVDRRNELWTAASQEATNHDGRREGPADRR